MAARALALVVLLCFPGPAWALTWWVRSESDEAALHVALASAWPGHDVDVRVGDPPPDALGAWHDGSQVVLRDARGERSAGAADWATQVALVRSWTREVAVEDSGWVPPLALPDIAPPAPAPPRRVPERSLHLFVHAGIGVVRGPDDLGAAPRWTGELGIEALGVSLGLLYAGTRRVSALPPDGPEDLWYTDWGARAGLQIPVAGAFLEGDTRVGLHVVRDPAILSPRGKGRATVPTLGAASRLWARPARGLRAGLEAGVTWEARRVWLEPDVPLQGEIPVDRWSGWVGVFFGGETSF